ncbi:MAG TPA: PBP1A family penicillin-binding protein, partial [Gammaproteobacteria bacterium]|nr:PBP1A family penicillin-binding protein [Gammaproteobacteria bacterium]
IFLTILALAVGFALVMSGLFIGAYYYLAPGLPQAAELRDIKVQVPLQVYSRDGRLIAEFGEQKRTPVSYDRIPPLLINAVVAAEDEHFFEHPGVDWHGVVRAGLAFLTGRDVGGSTITQQVPRTLDVLKRAGLRSGFDRFVAKYKEMILAYRMEQEFTKEEILELYLNTTFFGQRAYGVATAAQTYFGKNLDALSVSEIAILAGIPQRPAEWNPIYSTENAAMRRAYVLRRMTETGAIDDAQYKAALDEHIVAQRFGTQSQLEARYVAEMVRAEMVARFGNAATTAGLKVTTTIDSRLQAASNRAMHANLIAYDERHGYRGPLAQLALPAGAVNEADPLAPTDVDAEALRKLLEDYPTLLDYESAIVLGSDDVSARVFFADHGAESIGLDAVEWAGAFVNDDVKGANPTTVAEVLKAGDVVRFRRTAEGGWRLAQLPEAQGAFVALDPFDGAIVALNGGLDFFLNNFNRATQARRQPGSSFKPFVYSAAFENGFNPASVVLDAPVDVGYQPELERVWRPENFNGKYFGPTRLREALLESMNSVTIRMTQGVGVPTVRSHVKRFGFDDEAAPNDLSIALGAGGASPLSIAAGYATFANGGYKVTPYFIDRVVDANGEVVYETEPLYCPECNTPPETPVQLEPEKSELVADAVELYPQQRAAPRIISAQNAYLVGDLMWDNARRGTGARAKRELERNDLAGKTGTTNDGRDLWFVGFNANIVGASWVGFDQFRPLGAYEQGASAALPMWIGFMREALAGTAEARPKRPRGIVEYRINPKTGKIADDGTPNAIFEKFDIDHIPEREESLISGSFDVSDSGAETEPVKDIFLQ